MAAVVGETEAQIVKARLQSAYEAFGLLIPFQIKDRKIIDDVRVKYLAVATPLMLAAKGEYQEGGKEYQATLVLANALIDRIANITQEATQGIAILI